MWCLLLTGMPNSGKSTIAYYLVQKRVRNVLVIDGDKHREKQFLGEKLGFTKEDILRNTQHVIKLAEFAQEQGFNVLIPQIAPYKEHRELMKVSLMGFYEVYCKCSEKVRRERPNFKQSEIIYEEGTPDLVVDTGSNSIEECVNFITISLFGKRKGS